MLTSTNYTFIMFLTIVFLILTYFLLANPFMLNLSKTYCNSIVELKNISSPWVSVPVITKVDEFETTIKFGWPGCIFDDEEDTIYFMGIESKISFYAVLSFSVLLAYLLSWMAYCWIGSFLTNLKLYTVDGLSAVNLTSTGSLRK